VVSESFDPNDIEALRRRIAELEAAQQANLNGSGAIAQGGGDAVGKRAVKLDQNTAAIPARTPQQSDREVGRAAETAGPKRGCSDRRDGVDSLAMTFLKPSLRARTITA
jgi:hypothetical protein